MQFQGWIFDVDGVLVDSPHEAAWRESLRQLMAGPWHDIALRSSYAPDRFTTAMYQRTMTGKPRADGAAAALRFFDVADPTGALRQHYMDAKQTMLLDLAQQGRFTAFDDALRFVLDIRASGALLGVASSSKNANLFLGQVLLAPFVAAGKARQGSYPFVQATTSLLDLFDANTCGQDVAHGKPAPDLFLATAAALDLPPGQCAVVEDAPSGVQAAKAGGMACVGVARIDDAQELAAAGADWVVTNLDAYTAR